MVKWLQAVDRDYSYLFSFFFFLLTSFFFRLSSLFSLLSPLSFFSLFSLILSPPLYFASSLYLSYFTSFLTSVIEFDSIGSIRILFYFLLFDFILYETDSSQIVWNKLLKFTSLHTICFNFLCLIFLHEITFQFFLVFYFLFFIFYSLFFIYYLLLYLLFLFTITVSGIFYKCHCLAISNTDLYSYIVMWHTVWYYG